MFVIFKYNNTSCLFSVLLHAYIYIYIFIKSLKSEKKYFFFFLDEEGVGDDTKFRVVLVCKITHLHSVSC